MAVMSRRERMRRWWARGAVTTLVAILASLGPWPVEAQRRPVLAQVKAPHAYYFREMYLPRVTSGPSAVTWSPDGQSLAYSMQGSLWRQRIDSTNAEQLTSGPGYDLQPDWSRDGRRIVFVRYLDDAMELAQLDLASGEVTMLTRNRGVNVDPRWSPDGERLAWVSTSGTGQFQVYLGTITDGQLDGAALLPPRRSRVPRYYYSELDHELSPAWSPDGKELVYVGNAESAYGTGGIWRRALAADSVPVLLRSEETAWRTRPDWSPDGRRIAYSSFLGGQWHQFWVTTAAGGGDPIALSYGGHDITGIRWSPDAQHVAYVSNRSGNTAIELQALVGGLRRQLKIRERRYRVPMGELQLRITDPSGQPVSARVAVLGADGRAYAPDDAWIHADDGFDRSRSKFETHYFHAHGSAVVRVPAGTASITVWRGLEQHIERRAASITADGAQQLAVTMRSLDLPPGWSERWLSGDVHVHMNYGGTYRNTPQRLVGQAVAEDLDVVFNLIVNKEQRIPDIDYFSAQADAASTPSVLLAHAQEFHTSHWGHLGLLGLQSHFLLPDFAAYPNTAAASLYPTNSAVADLAHAQGALVGYVHPFDVEPDPERDAVLTNALPVDAALGKVDYYEVVGFSDPRASAAVWYRLLNCGFRLAAAGGTDAMANYASLRGPLGLNRVYVQPKPGAASREQRWLDGLRAGNTVATNAPLLEFTLDDRNPGESIEIEGRARQLRYRGFMRSAVPIEHLEVVQNGKVIRTIALRGDRMTADFSGSVSVTGSGWLLLRAWNEHASDELFDLYPYGTTNPVFITDATAPVRCGADADYLLRWIDRLDAAAAVGDYNTAAERESTLGEIRAARSIVERRR